MKVPEHARSRDALAVFALSVSGNRLPPQVLPYLAGLKQVASAVVVVCDTRLADREVKQLSAVADHVIATGHSEQAFGSYQRGVAWARKAGRLDKAESLILCDGSFYGPIKSFAPMVEAMAKKGLDVWAATDSTVSQYHLQSYFMVLGRAAFSAPAIKDYFANTRRPANIQNYTRKCEIELTRAFKAAGLKTGTFIAGDLKGVNKTDGTYKDLTSFPLYLLERGLPLVRADTLTSPFGNVDGIDRVLGWLKEHDRPLYDRVRVDLEITRFEDAPNVAFSLIMPTYNRAWCILTAIRSILGQYHRNFELIIVDDGSTDGTEDLVRQTFPAEIADGHIRYIHLPENVGVCNARNIGTSHARYPWIGYTDSDNELRPYFLTTFANAIVDNTDRDAFYAQMIRVGTGVIIGKPYSKEGLVNGNFIDLGVFVHRRSLLARFGGFDPDLRRLVDWDLCIRLTRHKDPVFIPRIVLDYTDAVADADRISVRESIASANVAIHARHSARPSVSTIILSYNHQEYIVEAIESALEQKGSYAREILLADDGSTDGTARVVERYAAKYPRFIRNISHKTNVGISENYRHCFREASGKFIAVLEGDDYWTDPEKNLAQAEFLMRNPSAAMVFSKILLFNMNTGGTRLLARQKGLAPLLTGEDVAKNRFLNLIANFSSAMFRRDIMLGMPSSIYEPRLSEIALSFYLDRLGKIGFIDKVMGVYRVNSSSVWTGGGHISRLQQSIFARETALLVARAEHRPKIEKHLNEQRQRLAAIMNRKQQPATSAAE